MSLPADAQAALERFDQARGWEQRARLLMQMGDQLPPWPRGKSRKATAYMAAKAWCGWWLNSMTASGGSRPAATHACCAGCWPCCW